MIMHREDNIFPQHVFLDSLQREMMLINFFHRYKPVIKRAEINNSFIDKGYSFYELLTILSLRDLSEAWKQACLQEKYGTSKIQMQQEMYAVAPNMID